MGFFQIKTNKKQIQMQIIQEQTCQSPKHTMKVKEKSNQCWTLKNFPWIPPTGACSPYFYLFHLPVTHIPSYYLPRITLNRQTNMRKGTNFWCTPEFDYYLCHYISWHQSSSCERDEGWEGVNSAISSSSLFDSERVLNQNPTEISKQSWVIAKKPSMS